MRVMSPACNASQPLTMQSPGDDDGADDDKHRTLRYRGRLDEEEAC